MSEMTLEKNINRTKRYFDYNLLAVLILLISFGLIMLYSTSAYMATMDYGDDMYFFKRQALFSFVSLAGALVLANMDYRIIIKHSGWIYLLASFLMILVQTPLGVEVNGARRWLNLGVQFQPSEFAKLAIITFLPYLIVKMGRNIRTGKGFLILAAIGGALGAITYVFTENLSTAIIVLGIAAGLIFVAHPKTVPFLVALAGVAIAAGVGLTTLVNSLQNSSSFRLQRILVWLRPEDYMEDGGYQVMQALYAIGSGGLFGKGLGNGVQKLGWVPEAQNDMIFSIVCEELGIFGAVLVLMLFGYLLYRLFFIAQNAPDKEGLLMVTGIFIHIALQVILNICVVINLIPTTGITLPFISYGGTSIAFLMAEMGLALSVARQIKFQEPESSLGAGQAPGRSS